MTRDAFRMLSLSIAVVALTMIIQFRPDVIEEVKRVLGKFAGFP